MHAPLVARTLRYSRTNHGDRSRIDCVTAWASAIYVMVRRKYVSEYRPNGTLAAIPPRWFRQTPLAAR